MIAKITQNEIDNTYSKYNRKYEGHKEDYFGLLYLSKKFNLSIEEASSYVAFGGNDYGIDAFYFDEEKRNLYLFQFKWSANHMLFKDSFLRLIKDGIERVFGDNFQDQKQNQLLNKLRTVIMENKNVIDSVFIYFVFDGDPEKAQQSRTLQSLEEDLLSKKYLIDSFLGREVRFNVLYISNRRLVGAPVQMREFHRYTIKCENILKLQASEKELIITFVPVNKLLEMYNDLREKLFSKNIRSGLGEGKVTNREIKRSLMKIISGEECAENFTFYHNGISITAEQLVLDDNTITMIEPRILNGAQTVMTLRAFVEKNKNDTRLSEKLPEIKVMARIIKSSDDEFLKKLP